MSKIVYRAATEEDVPQLVNLRVLMQCEVNGFDHSAVESEFSDEVEIYFARSLRDKTYFSAVADLDGELVATNGLVIYRKPPSLTGPSGIAGYVTNVYTKPGYRGQGIAGKLLDMLIEFAKNSNVAKLHLGATKSGKKVYEKAGFKPVEFEALELRMKTNSRK
ncbi:MAG: GNAT family N-acetyltransferase [Deltaproteobacteria bacterium]|nr:GNAT family N-acetyltransferase [Deltaproteobacteria bacterium]